MTDGEINLLFNSKLIYIVVNIKWYYTILIHTIATNIFFDDTNINI